MEFGNYGAVLHVNGKTGPRLVRIIHSVLRLQTWLEVHPLRSNPEASLFRSLSNKKYPVWTLLIMTRLSLSFLVILTLSIVEVSSLNVEDLAPGTNSGRLTVWTKSALESVEKRFAQEEK